MNIKRYIKIDEDGDLIINENIVISLEEEWSSLPPITSDLKDPDRWDCFTFIEWKVERVGFNYATTTVLALLGIILNVTVYDRDREEKIESDPENPMYQSRRIREDAIANSEEEE